MALPKACRALRCPNKTTESHGYCVGHKDLASWGKYQKDRGKNPYNNSKWRKTREAIMKRDRGMCCECAKKGIVRAANHCDHIIPISQGGSMWSYSNLQMLCEPCHQHKTATERC